MSSNIFRRGLFFLLIIGTNAFGTPRDYSSQANVAAQAYMTDPEYYKMVYLWNVRKSAEIEAINSRKYYQWQKEDDIQARIKAAEAFVNTDYFEDSWAYALVSDGASKIGLGDFAKQTMKSMPQLEGSTPYVQPDKAKITGTEIFKAAFDPNSSDHDQAILALKRIKYDVNVPYDQQGPIRLVLQNEYMKDQHDEIEKLLRNEKLTLQEQQRLIKAVKDAQTAALNQTAATAAKLDKFITKMDAADRIGRENIPWDKMTDDEKNAFRKEMFKESAEFADTLSGISQLVKDPEAARIFHGVATLDRAIEVAVTTTLEKSFAASPLSFINGYAGVGLALASVLGSSGNDAGFKAIFEALKKIAEQIEDLRKQMNARFDQLDLSTRSYFDQELFAVNKAGWTAQESLDLAIDLENRVQALHQEMNRGFHAAIASSESEHANECFKYGLSAATVDNCRDYYAQMSVSGLDGQDGKNLVSDEDLNSLKRYLNNPDMDRTVNPSVWIQYIKNYLRVFAFNPQMRARSKIVTPGYSQWSLAAIIRNGQNLLSTYRDLLLSGATMKPNVLNDLLDQYKVDAMKSIRDGAQIGNTSGARGPNPLIGFESPLPDNMKYSFMNDGVDFCPGAKGVEVAPNVKVGYLRRENDPSFPNGVMNSPQENTLRMIRHFEKDWVKASTLIPLMDSRLLWAARMGDIHDVSSSLDFGTVKVVPCWRSIKFPQITATNNWNFDFHVTMELEINVFYKKYGEPTKTFLYQAYKLDRSMAREGYAPFFRASSPECYPVLRILNEESLCRWDRAPEPLWQPVTSRKAIRDSLISENVDSADKQEFVAYLQSFEAMQKSQALAQLAPYSKQSFDSLKALRSAVRLGFNPRHPLVEDLASFLATDAGLPDEGHLARLGLINLKTDTVIQLLEERIRIARQKIQALSQANDLRPRTDEVSSLLNKLEKLAD